jgi:hypothetical protein
MITVIIYAAAEYPRHIHFNVNTFKVISIVRVQLGNTAMYSTFEDEIIAVTNETTTLWLNPAWLSTPFVTDELLPRYPYNNDGQS